MGYNKSKRALSLIATILGAVIALVAIVSVALAILDICQAESSFDMGDALNELFGLSLDFSGKLLQWVLIVVFFLIAYFDCMCVLLLLKKPLEVNGKFMSVGKKKFFFILFTLLCALPIILQLFSDEIIQGEKTDVKILIVLGVVVITCLLQLVSMFLRATKKEKKVSDVKEEKQDAKISLEDLGITEEQPVENKRNPNRAFNSVHCDPIADGLEQRVREIKHLRDAGLIDDDQALAAIEKIFFGSNK